MKTKEELNALKTEVEELNAKLSELSEEELDEVSGGFTFRGQVADIVIGSAMGMAVAGTDSTKVRISLKDE